MREITKEVLDVVIEKDAAVRRGNWEAETYTEAQVGFAQFRSTC